LKLISGHPLLAPAAMAAVKQWKYAPLMLNGDPVEVETTIDVNFTLQ
jgi:protein TonB